MDVVSLSFAFVRRFLQAMHSVYAPSSEIRLGQHRTLGTRRIIGDWSSPIPALDEMVKQKTPQTKLGAHTLGVQLWILH